MRTRSAWRLRNPEFILNSDRESPAEGLPLARRCLWSMADSTALLSSRTYLQGLRTHLENRISQHGTELPEEGMYQQGNIFEPFTKRREMQRATLIRYNQSFQNVPFSISCSN